MIRLTFDEVIVMKKLMDRKHGLYLHFHDHCTRQFFTFEEPVGDDVEATLNDYFQDRGYHVIFSDDRTQFVVA